MDSTRTSQQNRALHKYFQQLSEALNDAGLDFRTTVRDDIEVSWTPDMVKEYLFKHIAKAMFGKDSTADLTTKEISETYEQLNRHTSSKLGVSVDWPHQEKE